MIPLKDVSRGDTDKGNSAEAKQVMRNSMIKVGEEYALEGDMDRMEYYLNKLKDEYALDQTDVEYADRLLIVTYEWVAKSNSREKHYPLISNAITY